MDVVTWSYMYAQNSQNDNQLVMGKINSAALPQSTII